MNKDKSQAVALAMQEAVSSIPGLTQQDLLIGVAFYLGSVMFALRNRGTYTEQSLRAVAYKAIDAGMARSREVKP